MVHTPLPLPDDSGVQRRELCKQRATRQHTVKTAGRTAAGVKGERTQSRAPRAKRVNQTIRIRCKGTSKTGGTDKMGGTPTISGRHTNRVGIAQDDRIPTLLRTQGQLRANPGSQRCFSRDTVAKRVKARE